MREVRSDKEKLEAFKDDFCDKYFDGLSRRTDFIEAIKNLAGQ